MADRILGYPPTVTVTGNSVYWARGQYDPQIFAEFTTSDYIANTTDSDSKQITVVDGVQSDGSYKLTVADATGWVTGERMTPQIGATVAAYTAVSTALAATSTGDRWLRWYVTTDSKTMWPNSDQVGVTAKLFDIIGMLPNAQCAFKLKTADNCICFLGDFSAQTFKPTIRNVTMRGQDAAFSVGLRFQNSGAAGTCLGMLVDRVYSMGAQWHIWLGSAASVGCEIRNSLIVGGYACNPTAVASWHNNTFSGLELGFYGVSLAHVLKNNLVIDCQTNWYLTASCIGNNNSSDVTGDSIPGTSSIQVTNTTAKFMRGIVGGFVDDFRPRPGSALLGAGSAVSGVTYDLFGNTRPNPPSIGAFELPTTLESIPPAGYIRTGQTATDIYGTITTGTAGTSQDPGASYVHIGRAYVIDGTSLTGTEGTSEAPPTAYVRLGTSYKIYGATLTGTEGTSTDPGAANVLDGVAYTIDGTAHTGTATAGTLDYDYYHFDLDGSGNLYPLDPPRAVNYPVIADVRSGVVYGYLDQYTGTYAIGVPTLTPVLLLQDLGDGTGLTATVSNSDSDGTNKIYVWRVADQCTASLGATRTGDGTAAITTDGEVFATVITNNSGGGMKLGGGAHAYATAGTTNRTMIRDAAADVALRICEEFGVQVTITNPGDSAITVYAREMHFDESTGWLGGPTDETRFGFMVPRQTGFPPAGAISDGFFNAGATLLYDGITYSIERISGDNGNVDLSSTFTIEARVNPLYSPEIEP